MCGMKILPFTIQLTSLISVNSREFGDQPWKPWSSDGWTTVNVNFLKSVVAAVLIWTDMDMTHYEMI